MLKAVWIGTLAAAVVAAGLAPVYVAYSRDLGAARERASGGSAVIETASGPIEYAESGRGAPLLAIHGTGGGFDQGLLLTRQLGLDGAGYRIVAPSRYGYLRTPFPEGPTDPAAEADAHASLLDALGVREKVVVIGASAGAPSATHFAIRHPERVAALVLTVPDNWVPPSEEWPSGSTIGGSDFIRNVVLRSDFVMWAFMKLAGDEMASFIGVSKELQQGLTPEDRANIAETLDSIQPVSQRYRGIMKDEANHRARTRGDLERIQAPTLVVDAMDMETFPGARYTAEHIPQAKLVAFPTGGHLLVGHAEETRAAVREFLDEVATGQGR